jgi:hypothetical protein
VALAAGLILNEFFVIEGDSFSKNLCHQVAATAKGDELNLIASFGMHRHRL